MIARILVVDDEEDLRELLSMKLDSEGYLVQTAQNGQEALSIIHSNRPDLILLDIMLDDISGIKLTGKLKNSTETSNIPIILLTAKDTETDVVVGLSVGADDYITKPFSMYVLMARIEALLRRAHPEGDISPDILSAGPLKLILDSQQVIINGNDVELTGGEYKILLELFQAGGNILSREQLKTALGDAAGGDKERIIDVHIASLRKKLGPARDIIKTVHGRGYRFDT